MDHTEDKLMPYREKKIESGKIVEINIYPISKNEQKKSRAKKKKESRKEQKALNEKNAKKHLIRIINNNFTTKDIALHLTYKDCNMPKTYEEAYKDIRNFIRRVNRCRKKKGFGNAKYIAVIEEPKINRNGKVGRIHHHIIIDGELDRDALEKNWDKGRANADRLQEDENGFEALARYITKEPKGKKRWIQSKNLKMPEIKINDHKYSRRKVYELFKNKDDGRMFEKLYPGYVFTSCETADNDFTGIAVYIKMRKLE